MNNQPLVNIDRKPAVAGSFYPADSSELRKMLTGYFSDNSTSDPEGNTAAIIVPHAGYVFSGEVAAAGFSQLDPEKEFKTVFVIGCSHRKSFGGASVYSIGNYLTPLGTVPVDLETARTLSASYPELSFDPGFHNEEHSLEVEIPFLQFRLKKPFRIVPILLGTQDTSMCRRIAEILKPYFTPENLFVISTDFSHYPAYADAVKVDRALSEAITANNPATFLRAETNCRSMGIDELATGCCSWPAVFTLLCITEKDPDINYKQLMYKNSGDSPFGEKERVVGYHAIHITRRPEVAEFMLMSEDKKALLSIARNTLNSYLETQHIPETDPGELTPVLLRETGVFVTLKKEEKLRGCIGRFEADKPLYELVQETAIAAATQDTRFSRVNPGEMKDIKIEISVLTPLRKIQSVNEIKLGRDGIYLKKGGKSGTFLPQVATDTGWTLEEFLGYCARDKAGIGWEGWKDKNTELFVYQAIVFGE